MSAWAGSVVDDFEIVDIMGKGCVQIEEKGGQKMRNLTNNR
jgi:hypothetical protein